jgi:hypothetical protein
MSARPTQCERVLQLLADGREHSTIEFIELGILRPPSRVHELREGGFTIDVRRVDHPGCSTVYVYRLVSSEPRAQRCEQLDRDPPDGQAETAGDVVLPSPEERRRIASEARAAFARAIRRRDAP